MIATINRLTTDYVDTEDRMRLSGHVADGPPVVMWLTQRLALRLLPEMLKWLDKQIGSKSAQVVHSFAQEAAVADLPPLERVQPATSDVWLIQQVDIGPADERITLVFKTADGRAAGVGVTAVELRQWLAIMRGVWLNAGWPDTPWPDWMKGEARTSERQIILH